MNKIFGILFAFFLSCFDNQIYATNNKITFNPINPIDITINGTKEKFDVKIENLQIIEQGVSFTIKLINNTDNGTLSLKNCKISLLNGEDFELNEIQNSTYSADIIALKNKGLMVQITNFVMICSIKTSENQSLGTCLLSGKINLGLTVDNKNLSFGNVTYDSGQVTSSATPSTNIQCSFCLTDCNLKIESANCFALKRIDSDDLLHYTITAVGGIAGNQPFDVEDVAEQNNTKTIKKVDENMKLTFTLNRDVASQPTPGAYEDVITLTLEATE